MSNQLPQQDPTTSGAGQMEYDRRTAKIAMNYHRAVKGQAPISIHAALTDACFNRCPMCEHPMRPQRKMTAQSWIEFLRKPEMAALESVCYAGGDPMAFPEFNEVMAYHVERGLSFGMTITGYVPSTVDMKLLAHAAWVRVSLDAITPEVYERVRGHTPVRKVLAGIDKMLAAGVKVALGITVHKGNIDDMPNVKAYAEQKGITNIDVRHLNFNTTEETEALRLGYVNVYPFKRCHAALFQVYVDASGDVYPCCVAVGDTKAEAQTPNFGNIFTDQWSSIRAAAHAWRSIEAKDLPPVCGSCITRLTEINHVVDKLEEQFPSGYQSFY